MSNVAATDPNSLASRQFIRTSRRVTRWTFASLQLVLLLAAALLVTWVVNYNPVSWDFTESRLFSLSPQSRSVLQALDQPVELTAFVPYGKAPGVERLLLAYQEASRNVTYRLVDPEADPALAMSLGVRATNTLFVEAGDSVQRAAAIDEPAITNAVLAATRGEAVPVCFLIGHGERAATGTDQVGYSAAAGALTQTNYKVNLLNVIAEGQVPAECRSVVIAGPQSDLLPQERRLLEEYLDDGGRVLLMFESRTEVPELAQLVGRYGLEVHDDFILDTAKNAQQFGLGMHTPLVDTYERHAISEGFGLMSMFSMPRSITFAAEPAAGVVAVALASTSPSSWGETSTERGAVATYDAGTEVRGPLPLVIAVAEAVEETPRAYRERMRAGDPPPMGPPMLVVFGDADFASNSFFGWQGNGDLFVNSLNWLTDQEDLISIMPKEIANKRVLLTSERRAGSFLLLVVLLPLLPAVTGAVIMFRKVK